MTHNRLCLNIYAVGILVQIAAGLLLTNSWSRDVYTGRHFDELIADDNGHVTRNALLLLYSPSCDAGLHSNVMSHHQITDSHQMVFAKYDYISTPKYVWYHMDRQDNLRLRYQPQHCMQLLLFLNNTDILKPTKVYELATWDQLSDVTREAQQVHFVILNDFGRQIDISVESDVGEVKHNTTSEFKQERSISACVADIITVRQTRNARAIKLMLVTRDMDATKVSIAWTEPYVDEQVWRQETQKTFDEQLAQFKAFEYQLAQRYLHDLKQPAVVPVFTEFCYKIQRLPPFLLRPLYEHYDLRRQNTELIQSLGNAKYLNIPLEQAVKLQFSSVMKVIAQDWCDASLILTKTSHFREHGPGFRSSTHLGNLASQVIGVYAVLKEDLNPFFLRVYTCKSWFRRIVSWLVFIFCYRFNRFYRMNLINLCFLNLIFILNTSGRIIILFITSRRLISRHCCIMILIS